MDQIVRQTTEMGVDRIVPLFSEHTLPRWKSQEEAEQKAARWNRIAREAVQQSGRSSLPAILPPARLKNFLAEEHLDGVKVFLHHEPLGGGSLHELLVNARDGICLLVGPEGGLSGDEARMLLEHDFSAVHVPGTILRSETAAVFGIAATQIIVKERNVWKLVS